MKVSLSGSERQLRCMAYSSGRLSGSDAVASCISCGFGLILMFPLFFESHVYFILHPGVVRRHVMVFIWDEKDVGC